MGKRILAKEVAGRVEYEYARTQKINWTPEMVGYIEDNYGRMTRAQLARYFGCTVSDIDDIIDKEGILIQPEHALPINIRRPDPAKCESVWIPELKAYVTYKKGKDPKEVVRKFLNRNKSRRNDD